MTRLGQAYLADVHVQALGADVRLGALPGDLLATFVATDFRRFDRGGRRGARFGSATQGTDRKNQRTHSQERSCEDPGFGTEHGRDLWRR